MCIVFIFNDLEMIPAKHFQIYLLKTRFISVSFKPSTVFGLVTSIGGIDMGPHSLRQWLVAWQLYAITLTNLEWSSVDFRDIHLWT